MFDYSPFNRSSVGFDRLFRLLDEAANVENQAWPPYNIERLGENDYRITIAVAGFGPADIAIESKGNTLTVSGKKAEKADPSVEVLHQPRTAGGNELTKDRLATLREGPLDATTPCQIRLQKSRKGLTRRFARS